MIDVSALRSKLLLSLALLRELYNKVNYYKAMATRNIDHYREYIEKVSRIAPEKAKIAEKEMSTLRVVDSHLNSISLFLEGVMLRIETLIMAGNVATAAVVLKDVVKVLKQNMTGMPPLLFVLVDRLNDISRNIVNEMQKYGETKTLPVAVLDEALKIVDEAKKASGLK